MRFAPYELNYLQLRQQMADTGFDMDEGKGGMWAQVDDFRWHRSQHSPNWSILPALERVREINGCAGIAIQNDDDDASRTALDVASSWTSPVPAVDAGASAPTDAGVAKHQNSEEEL